MPEKKPVWDQIQEKSKEVETLEGLYKTMEKVFEADGVVTKDEKAKLNKIQSGINQAKANVEALVKQYEANKKKWEGRTKDLALAKKQSAELKDWDDPDLDLEPINDQIGFAEDEAGMHYWLSGIEELDAALVMLKRPYKEYQDQLPHRDRYNAEITGIREHGNKIPDNKFFILDEVAQPMRTFEQDMDNAAEAADARRYDDACRYMDDANATLADVDKEIETLTEKENKCQAELNSIIGDAAIYARSEFDTVKELMDALDEAKTECQDMIDAFEFDDVLADLEIARQQLDKMKAEQEAKEKEKTAYENKEGVVKDCQKKISEAAGAAFDLSSGIAAAVKTLGETAAGIATDAANQNWKEAVEKIDGLKTQVEGMWAAYEAEKKKAEEKKEWEEGKEAEHEETKKKAEEVEKFGGKGAEGATEETTKTDQAAESEQYKEAAKSADEAKSKVDEKHKEMEEQKKALEKYEVLKKDFDTQYAKFDPSEYKNDDISKIHAELKTASDEMVARANEKDYVVALKGVEGAAQKIKELEGKVAEEEKKREEAAKLIEEMSKKVGEIVDTTSKKISEAAKSVKDGAEKADETYKNKDFDAVKKTAKEVMDKAVEVAKDAAKFLEEQKKWEERKPTHDEVLEQVKQLIEWQIEGAKAIKDKLEQAVKKASEEAFEDAVGLVDEAKNQIAPMIEKLDKEKRAEIIYKGLKAAYDAQAEAVRQSRHAAAETVRLILDQVDKVIEPVKDLVVDKQFERATELVQEATKKLGEILKEIQRLESLEQVAKDTLKAATDKIAEAERQVFESLKDMATAVKNGAAEVEKQLEDVKNIDDAVAKAKQLAADAAEYAKKAAEKAAEKEGWDKKVPDLEAVKKQIDDLRAKGSREANRLMESAKKTAETAVKENWAEALAMLESVKADAMSTMSAMPEEEMPMADGSGKQAPLSPERKKERDGMMANIEKQIEELMAKLG